MKDLPDTYGYKFLSQELTRFRMKVVDENDSIRAIEDKISAGLVEELIFQAHNEIKLLRLMKNWKPWEYLMTRDYEEKETMNMLMNVSNSNPLPGTFDRFDDARHVANARAASAHVHPENKE